MIFFTMALRPFMKYHSPPCFPSYNVTKNAETHPLPVRDVIVEQPHDCINQIKIIYFDSVLLLENEKTWKWKEHKSIWYISPGLQI